MEAAAVGRLEMIEPVDESVSMTFSTLGLLEVGRSKRIEIFCDYQSLVEI
jgi:hypothetical protein